jgi:hypothetical protein
MAAFTTGSETSLNWTAAELKTRAELEHIFKA